MQVPLLDLKKQYSQLKAELLPQLEKLYESQMMILGEPVSNFEKAAAEYCRSNFACGVSSGTDALLMAVMAEKIGAGDEVITSPYTFFATAGAIFRAGAVPVFVDIDPISYTLDASQIEAKITSRTKAIIPVHLYGQAANMQPIMDIAQKHGLAVIEDAAQAIGAECLINGAAKRVCSIGDYGCLSFFPSKNLGAFGDAGMVTTMNKTKADRIHSLRNHGMEPKYYHQFVGGNFRMDALQAVVLNVKIKYLDQWTDARQKNAARYDKLFNGVEGITTPAEASWSARHVRNQYVIRIAGGKRQKVWDGLKNAGVGCDVYYPVPLHMQECFKEFGYRKGEFPESEKAAMETLAIPVFPDLTEEQQIYVADTVKKLMA